jgi:ParB-like chromosome segregation protein Spo0J
MAKSAPISLPECESVEVLISSITDLPTKNPNRMSDQRYRRLVRNIRTYGFLQPILIYRKGRSKNSFILSDGWHRRKAMLELGQVKIKAMLFKSQADAEEAARVLRIAMNQIRGEGSIDGLAEEIKDMLSAGIDKVQLEDTGVDSTEINAILNYADVDVSSLLNDVRSEPNSGPAAAPMDIAPRSHKLTFIFATEADKQTVVEKLESYDGGPAESLLQALLS